MGLIAFFAGGLSTKTRRNALGLDVDLCHHYGTGGAGNGRLLVASGVRAGDYPHGPRAPVTGAQRPSQPAPFFMVRFIIFCLRAIFLTYMARYLVEIFVGEDRITLWQGMAQIPFMLLGIWIAGWLLPRAGKQAAGLFMFLLMVSQAGFSAFANEYVVASAGVASWGLARSSQRQSPLAAWGSHSGRRRQT